jgi:hypothetical protein
MGYEVLDPDGWTTEEEAELEKVLDRFSRQVCPAPEFISVVGSSFRARHVDDERDLLVGCSPCPRDAPPPTPTVESHEERTSSRRQ